MIANTRFFERVNKTDTCWNWLGSFNEDGYGRFWLDGKTILAHHFLVLDKIPNGLLVLHKCDNRKCVNPDHMFFGTQKENFQDMLSKGRQNQRPGWEAMMKVRKPYTGEGNPRAKLTKEDVIIIRATPKQHGYMSKLARQYKVTHEAIRRIINNETWADLSARDRKESL